jgi:hypothetical protein
MTYQEAKEKALEIFNEHYFYLRANLMYDEEAKEDAKQCALITINKILIEIRKIYDIYTEVNIIKIYQYLEEVKIEILKL